MSGFTLQEVRPNQFETRFWFGTNDNNTGINLGFDQVDIGSQDIIYGFQGDDVISADLSPSVIAFGGQGDDIITGSKVFLSINVLAGDLGNDTITAQGGTITQAFGMQGNDVMLGSNNTGFQQAAESLFGGQDNDVVRGFAGADFLTGDRGADIIWGDEVGSGINAGSDTIFGGTDSDTMVGGGGNDSLYGGQGDDYIEVAPGLVNDSTNTRIPTSTQDPTNSMIAGSDTVFGDLGNDTIGRLVSSTESDWYDGGEGNDSIQGANQGGTIAPLAGDTLLGGNGNDTIRGGTDDSGRDSIRGGAGDDSIIGGNETGDDGAYNPALTRFGDIILGDAGNDNIDAQDGNDSVSGGTGNDSIQGAGGTDTLLGDDQNDTLVGGDGSDSLLGGSDQDILEGGAGSDTLTGFDGSNRGDGVDRFVYNLASILSGNNIVYNPSTAQADPPNPSVVTRYDNVPSAVTQASADYITVFDPTQDVIQINSLTNVTSTAGTVPVDQVPGTATGPFTATGTATTANFGGTPVNIGGTTPPMVAIGSTYIIGAASGNVATPITTFDATAANSLIYIERDGVAGFNGANDIALATVLGTRPTDLGAANFA